MNISSSFCVRSVIVRETKHSTAKLTPTKPSQATAWFNGV